MRSIRRETCPAIDTDYWLVLDLDELPWARYQTWTLVDAATGIILEQAGGHLLQNALHDAVGAIGRRWPRGKQVRNVSVVSGQIAGSSKPLGSGSNFRCSASAPK